MEILFDDQTIWENHDRALIQKTERKAFVQDCLFLGLSYEECIVKYTERFSTDINTAEEDVQKYWPSKLKSE